MKRTLCLLLIALLLFSSCATKKTGAGKEETDEIPDYAFNSSVPDSVQYETLFEEYNKYGGSVAMGISGPYVNRENAIAAATLNCVQMLSFYRGLAMQTDMSAMTDDGTLYGEDFDSLTIGGTSDAIFRRTAAEMEIVEVIWFGGNIGAAVFATLPEMEEVEWNESWDDPEADSDDRIIASDCSYGKYASYKKAIEASVFQAAKELMQVDANGVNVNNTLIETTTRSYQNHSYSISGSRMEDFTVVAFRYDAESGKVHALVAASN